MHVRYPFAGKIYNLDTILDNLTSICFKRPRFPLSFKVEGTNKRESKKKATLERNVFKFESRQVLTLVYPGTGNLGLSFYSGIPIFRYGKGQQNHIIKPGYRCKQTKSLYRDMVNN